MNLILIVNIIKISHHHKYSYIYIHFFLIGKIEIITNDGRVMVGILKGYDQVINIILSDCEERVYSNKGVEIVHLGLYVIRGDDV